MRVDASEFVIRLGKVKYGVALHDIAQSVVNFAMKKKNHTTDYYAKIGQKGEKSKG